MTRHHRKEWPVVLLTGRVPWSDLWSPETRRLEIDVAMRNELWEFETNEPGFMADILEHFREDMEGQGDELVRQLEERNDYEVARLAHLLAGGAVQVAAVCIAVHLRAIERSAREHDFDRCHSLLDSLPEHVDQFVRAIAL